MAGAVKTGPHGSKSQSVRKIADRYAIRGFLARGGMGAVYDAFDERLSRQVAIKVLVPEAIRDPVALGRFQSEVKILGTLAHPRIVTIFDAGTTPDGSPYLVMEKLSGEPLSSRIKRDGPLSLKSSIEIAAQVLDALIATHGRGILHRDLKPENVFLERTHDRTISVRLLDFGLARKTAVGVEDKGAETHFTRPGRVVGTPAYMAFEQATGERDLDARADLYALGVILFESITGKLPWVAREPLALAVEMNSRPPTLLRAIRDDSPPWLEHLVRLLMAKEREHRPQDAKMALRLLRAGESGFVTNTGEIIVEAVSGESDI
jgi:serine/threonine-protein kinase